VAFPRVILAAGLLLLVVQPFWVLLPGVSYVMEIMAIVVILATVVELRAILAVAAALSGLVIGVVMSSTLLPVNLFFPLWAKAVLPALTLGVLVARGRGAGIAFTAAAVIAGAAMLILYIQGAAAINHQLDLFRTSMERMLTVPLAAQGYSAETVNEMSDKLAVIFRVLARLMPAMLIMSAIGQLFIAFLIVDWYYTRRDTFFPGFGSFIYWKMPEIFLYLVAVAVVIRAMATPFWQQTADNLLFMMALVYAVAGLSLVENWLRRIRLPLFVKIIFYVGLVLMQAPGLVLMALIAVFDSYFDFRRVKAHTLG
jgi:hypothetical protein